MIALASAAASRAMDDLGEDLRDGARGIGVERAVHGNDAAERGHRIAGQRPAIGVGEIFALRDAAWIGVLDDDAGCRTFCVELGDAFISGIGIVDVVVGELLALQLPRGGDAGAHVGYAIERRPLMRVLAVTQPLDKTPADRTVDGGGLGKLMREPARDRRIVDGGARVSLGSKHSTKRKRGHALVPRELGEHHRIVAGIDDDRDIGVILGGGADHGRAADVDVPRAGRKIRTCATVDSNG